MSMKERDYFMSLLSYDPLTGVFNWKARRTGVTIGMKAGTLSNHGYYQITIDQKRYMASKLAWLFVHGEWPKYEIDHINGIRDDNRISNLRDVTHRKNQSNQIAHRNGKTIGVSHYTDTYRSKPWQAQIWIDGKKVSIGYFKTEREAHSAYIKVYDKIEARDAI